MTQIAKERDFVDVGTLRQSRYQRIKEEFIDLIQEISDRGDTKVLINEEEYDETILSRIRTELESNGYEVQRNPLTGILTISWGEDE